MTISGERKAPEELAPALVSILAGQTDQRACALSSTTSAGSGSAAEARRVNAETPARALREGQSRVTTPRSSLSSARSRSAGCLRLIAVGLRGTYIDFDEAMYIGAGKHLVTGQGFTLNGLPNATFPFGTPLVAGAFWMLTGSARWALNLPTAVFGALGVLPVYLIMRATWDRAAGATAAVLYAGFPPMLFLIPYCRYAERLYSGSEVIFAFFMLSAAYVFLRAVRRPGAGMGSRSGSLRASASRCARTRPGTSSSSRRFSTASSRCASGARGCRARPGASPPRRSSSRSSPRRFSSGRPPHRQVVHRPAVHQTFVMRNALDRVIYNDDWGEGLKEYFAPNADDTEIETAYYGVSPYHRERIEGGAEDISVATALEELRPSKLPEAWRALWYGMLPTGAWVLALVGLVSALRERRWGFLAAAAALVIPAVWVTMTLYVLRRFYVVPSLAALLVGARGVDLCVRALLGHVSRVLAIRSRRSAAAAYLAVPVALSLWMASSTLARARAFRLVRSGFERAQEDKIDALLPDFERVVPPGSRVVAWAPMIAARTPTVWLAMPEAPPADIVRYAWNRRADFILVRGTSGYFERYSPDDFVALLGDGAVVLDRRYGGERFVLLDMHKALGPSA